MSQIKPYKRCKKCGAWIVSGYLCKDCKPMTNGDKIRAMTDEQIAEMISNIVTCCGFSEDHNCENCRLRFMHRVCSEKDIFEWLREEVSEDAGTD